MSLLEDEQAALESARDVAASMGRLVLQLRDLGHKRLAELVEGNREVLVLAVQAWREGR